MKMQGQPWYIHADEQLPVLVLHVAVRDDVATSHDVANQILS